MTHYFEFATASNFSFLRGASHPEELMLQAEHLGLAGLGLADRNTVAGVVRAHLIKREQKLTLAYHPGAHLVFADGTPDILVYPRDRAGWAKLCRLLTVGNLRAEKGDCILFVEDLIEYIDGLELVVMERSTRNDDGGPGKDASPASLWGKPTSSLTLPRTLEMLRLTAIQFHPNRDYAWSIRKSKSEVFFHSFAKQRRGACGSLP